MIITCPHCHLYIEIEQVNCAIFRHGVFKSNFQQLPPHSPKEVCDNTEVLWGCGKPFKLIKNADGALEAIKCLYL